MYKVSIKSKGKYNNWTLGDRYCLFAKDAINLIATAKSEECEVEYSKFICLSGFVYGWSSVELKLDDKFIEKIEKKIVLKKSEE